MRVWSFAQRSGWVQVHAATDFVVEDATRFLIPAPRVVPNLTLEGRAWQLNVHGVPCVEDDVGRLRAHTAARGCVGCVWGGGGDNDNDDNDCSRGPR